MDRSGESQDFATSLSPTVVCWGVGLMQVHVRFKILATEATNPEAEATGGAAFLPARQALL
jgi:hypothetical protein